MYIMIAYNLYNTIYYMYDTLWYGMLWFKLQKDYKGARQQYETVLRLDPGNKIGRENLNKLERLERSRKN